MKRLVTASLALAALSSAAYAAESYPRRPIAYQPQGYLNADELREYGRDQLEARQEMEKRAMRLRHKAERRALDPSWD